MAMPVKKRKKIGWMAGWKAGSGEEWKNGREEAWKSG
jgi:hypothetical protein